MALRQEQHISLTQKLSPLQMQVIKLIELTSVELEDKIKQEIEDNPALETAEHEDEFDAGESDELSQEELILGDYASDEDVPDYRLKSRNSDDAQLFEMPITSEKSLHEALLEQIGLREESAQKKIIAENIIGNLDKNGYLQRDLQSIRNDLLLHQNIDVAMEEVEKVLTEVHDLDPPGIGARDLRECLLIQLSRRENPDEAERRAMKILSENFKEFTHKHYDKIMRQQQLSHNELKGAIDEIVSLNPKPGNVWSDSLEIALSKITPDFIAESENGNVTISLNNMAMPILKVNHAFNEMMQGYANNKKSMSNDDKQAMMFMKQKMDAARWFIDAVQQRQHTLQKTMKAIVSIQHDFFVTGDEKQLKPMILKDVAEKTGLDISTISRVSNSKYVQTATGVYPLKFFFSETMQNDAGEDISSHKIKLILQECIENENSIKPLTDEKLTAILNEKGYVVARRTVAKYREQLSIPVARLRKKL